VFKQWRAKKVAAKEEKLRKETEERVRKGILNGREIFLEAGNNERRDWDFYLLKDLSLRTMPVRLRRMPVKKTSRRL